MAWDVKGKQTLPQHSFGVDWGRPRTLIMRDGTKILFWVPGHTGWASRGTTSYYAGSLQIFDSASNDVLFRNGCGKRLAEGGFCTAHLKDPAVRQKIAEFFGTKEDDLPVFKRGKSYVRVRG